MNRSLFVAVLGAALSSILQAQETAQQSVRIPWPAELAADIAKVDTGSFVQSDRVDALVLADGELDVVSGVGIAPVFGHVADGVADFAVLPGPGVSRFLATTATGLWIGSASGEQLVLSKKLAAGSWGYARSLSVVDVGTNAFDVAATTADGALIVRGRLVNATWSPLAAPVRAFPAPPIVQCVALDVDRAVAGTDVAYATASELMLVSGDGLVTHVGPLPTLAGLTRIARIPFGHASNDSLAYFLKHVPAGGGLEELLYELHPGGLIGPIYGYDVEIADVDVAHVGADGLADLVIASPASEEIVALHGMPETFPLPFFFLFDELAQIPFTESIVGPDAPLDVRHAAGDLDGDGDGDVVFLATSGGGTELVVVRGHDSVDGAPIPHISSSVSSVVGGGSTTIDFDIHLNVEPSVRVPTPDRLFVRVYTREGIGPTSYVTSTPWVTGDFPVDVEGNATIAFEGLPAPYEDVLETLFYVELQGADVTGQPAPGVFGAKTAWVSVTDGNGELLRDLWCAEADEFSRCPSGLEPIEPEVTAINRRSFIAPRPLSPPPQ